MVACKNCGFSSFITSEMVLKKIPVFTAKPIKAEEKSNLKYVFHYFRHGADTPQMGIILELTTSKVKFSTLIKLEIGSKISFYIKNKKFIVNIRQVEMILPNSNAGKSVTQYEIIADLEVVRTEELKEKPYNPHYLIK